MAPPTEPGVSLQVTIHIDPSQVDAFFAAFRPVYDAVVAEAECSFFEVYLDPQEPGKISWVENWSKSIEWLMSEQITKDYYKPYFAVTEPMFTKPREFKVLSRVSGFRYDG